MGRRSLTEPSETRTPFWTRKSPPPTRTPRAAFDETFDIIADRDHRYLLHNRTPKQIRIVTRDPDSDRENELVLPPLAQRVVVGARLALFKDDLYRLRQRHQLRVRTYHPPHRGSRIAFAFVGLSILALVAVIIHDVLKEGTLERREVFISAVITATASALVLGIAAAVEAHRRVSEEVLDTDEGDIEFGMGGAFYDGNETLRHVKHIFTLLLVITIGAVLPAIAIFVATDAKDFLVMNGGLDVVDGKESQLVGRTIQVLYTAVLSLFPALLYFQFERHRVGTIRSEWVRAIFRMDQGMETLADVNARYGDELGEASSYSTDSVRLLGGRNSPIIVATLLISLGWTLLVAQTGSFDFTRFSTGQADVERANFQFLVPTPSAAAMAFLGAYFFGTYLILRSYYRGDLRPKVYNQITARLITVVVLAYLIQTLFVGLDGENRPVWALSFFAGVVPTTVLQHVRDLASSFGTGSKVTWAVDANGAAIQRRGLKRAFESAFPTRRSLTQLDGVDIHDSTRLETEGITDVPSLATADLVSVMVSTRLPVDRLVDWMDQAVLVMLLDDVANDELDSRVARLRRIGIRTASGVLAANDGVLGPEAQAAADRIIASKSSGESPDASTPPNENSLTSLAAQIRREPAMRRIIQWYDSEYADVSHGCQPITIRNNGEVVETETASPSHADPVRAAHGNSRIQTPFIAVLNHETTPGHNGD